MRLLLDTHVFIWSFSNPEKLSMSVRELLLDPDNRWLVSIVSIWELQIKFQLGKLNLPLPLPELVQEQQQINQLEILTLDLAHVYALEGLLNHHRDPFDRILIAQSLSEEIPIVSRDAVFDAYAVRRLWD